jgi:hypothetical protein
MKCKARLLASFDSRQLGKIDASHAKVLLSSWVETVPDRMFGYTVALSDRETLLAALRMEYTPDRIEYKVMDDQIDVLTLAALGDHLSAFAQGWVQSFLNVQRRLIRIA